MSLLSGSLYLRNYYYFIRRISVDLGLSATYPVTFRCL